MRVRDRNQRVARRAGATVATTVEDTGPVLVVPEGIAFEVALFASLPTPDRLWRLRTAEGGPTLWWGPAATVASALAGDGAALADDRTLPLGVAFDVSTTGAARRAGRALLRRTTKVTDGFVSRHVNRPISRWFSYRFLKLGLAPVHATFVNLLIGLGAAWLAAGMGWLPLALAGALFQFASIFDGVDGEMARATLRESPRGAQLDTLVDNVTYVACLIGFLIGWAREGMGPVDLGLIAVTAVGVPVTLLQVAHFVRRYAPNASFVFLDTCVRRAAHISGATSLRVASHLFYALRRDLFSVIFLAASLSGSRAIIIGLVVAGLGVANYTLLAHRRRLVAAATATA